MDQDRKKKPDALPDGSFDFVQIPKLTDEDADFIADWMAKACAKIDCFKYMVIGKTYEEDPEAHRLFARANLDRATVVGIHFVNKPRTAIRTVFPPGHRDQRLDCDWVTPYDENWNGFVELCGGKELLKERRAATSRATDKVLFELYGEDGGLGLWKTCGFAVHPNYQGKGIGSALHKHIATEAQKDGKKWFFLSQQYNVPFYEKMGCKVVGEPIATGLDKKGLDNYRAGNEYSRVCQVDP